MQNKCKQECMLRSRESVEIFFIFLFIFPLQLSAQVFFTEVPQQRAEVFTKMSSLTRTPGNTLNKKLLSDMEIPLLKPLQERGPQTPSTFYLRRNQNNAPHVMNEMELAPSKRDIESQSGCDFDLITRNLQWLFVTSCKCCQKNLLITSLKAPTQCFFKKLKKHKSFIYQTQQHIMLNM